MRRVLAVLSIVLVVVACGGPAPSASTVAAVTQAPSARPAPTAVPSPTAPVAEPSSPVVTGPLASSGSVALLAEDGSLSVVDDQGRSTAVSDATDGTLGFPAWSPDGSRIATVRTGQTDASILVFDISALASGAAPEPLVIFQSTSIGPFYLFWTPDGQAVSFLANEAESLSLRIAPADGTAPLDGSGPGALVSSGSPLYYDWIEGDRLLAHIGFGSTAFLGEMDLDGEATAPALSTPGNFRSAVVNRDEDSIAFVRATADAGEVVVSARDGSNEHATDVFGTAAVMFDPAGETIASIGPTEPDQSAVDFPLGPLRLIDVASGDIRTLIDGLVVSFWWSPDGQTIAALRVQPIEDPEAPANPLASPTAPASEIRLLFVDVATSEVYSDPVVRLGPRFVNAFLAYFDQYSLSHRVWAPDSSSILLPEVGDDGMTRVIVRSPDGGPPVALGGEIGFWSP